MMLKDDPGDRRLQEAAWKLVNRWRDQGKLPEPSVPSAKEHPSITCPRCGFTSYHPKDIAEGYCGQCHDWTRKELVDAKQDA